MIFVLFSLAPWPYEKALCNVRIRGRGRIQIAKVVFVPGDSSHGTVPSIQIDRKLLCRDVEVTATSHFVKPPERSRDIQV
jgi:hypothetical protein